MVAVEKNSKNFQYFGRNLKNDDDIFKIAFQQNEEYLNMQVRDSGKLTFNHKF